MTLLLDTHVLLWWLFDDDRLTPAGALPRHHDDPFDRMLIAQAVRRRFVLVTADRRFADYDVLTLA